MPFDDRPLVEQRSPSNADTRMDTADGLIQTPDLNRKGEPRQHAIRDINQAREVVRKVMYDGRNRSIINARLMAKANSERPYEQAKLVQEGLGWRSNFSTRPFSTILEKVFPRFVQAVDGLKYLTDSSLSKKWTNCTEKTEAFRKAITDCIRGRKGWKTAVETIAYTNALYGSAVVGWLDEQSWFPHVFAHDESFVNDGCKQSPELAQVVVLKEVMLPHELFAMIKDRKEAEAVGWDIEATIKAINNASPTQSRDILGLGGSVESWYVAAVRELNLGASYTNGASVISVYSLLVQEVSGKVSHYRLAGDALDLIFAKDERFENSNDCLAFFTFERGNGTIHGSKGIGRQIYELASMQDRSRNELVDRSILSGKTLIQGDPKRLHTFKMSVVGSTCIIPNGWNVLENKIDGNVEPFLRLDAYFGMIIDQIVGNVSPPQLGGQGEAFRSPAAWQLLAAREEETKDARITRFMEQFVCMVQTMQRRICRKDVEDDDAKAVQEKLLEIMTREELDELANKPVASTVRDLTPLERQMIVAVAAEKKGNPLFNQRQLEVEDLTARLDDEFANRVLLPVNDPTEEAEQTRGQLLEITLLAHGQKVPVSPRDNDLIHLKALLPTVEQYAQQMMQGQLPTDGFEILLSHVTDHVNSAQAKGVPKDDPIMQQAVEIVKQSGAAIAKLKELDAQAQQLQQESAQLDQAGLEQPPPA